MEFAHPTKKVLDKMNETQAQKIYDHIELLKRKPFRSSPGMNIDKLAGKQKPPAYRLKIDRIRVEYFVDGQMIVCSFQVFDFAHSLEYICQFYVIIYGDVSINRIKIVSKLC